MSETEKQEGQKTVVAFIAGLLIGGLLVWVFSSSPENTQVEETSDTDVETVTESTTNTNTETGTITNSNSETQRTTNTTETETISEPVDTIRDGNIIVSAQPAGSVVVLDSVTYPTTAGWIVVRDFMDGIPGSILGAARYHETDGLMPTSVNLLRATEVEGTYQIVFFSENGDRVFDFDDDREIEGSEAVFKAQ